VERNHGARKPYPLSWEEQALLFGELRSDPNGQMALFKVNTGLREQEVCNLQWDWEAQIPELETTVFVDIAIFSEDGRSGVKNREDRLVVLNAVAKSVIETRRGKHPQYFFGYRGKKLECMNNTAWQNAPKSGRQDRFDKPAPWGFEHLRIHDLKHTFGRRLRAAGVPFETGKCFSATKTAASPRTTAPRKLGS
jgi:integrase